MAPALVIIVVVFMKPLSETMFAQVDSFAFLQ
jgi:hypothetical protein